MGIKRREEIANKKFIECDKLMGLFIDKNKHIWEP